MNRSTKGVLAVAAAIAILAGTWGATSMMDQEKETPNLPYTGHGGTFKNTLAEIDTPDPSIVYHGGFYYMTFTHNGTDVMVMKSRTLDFREAERKVVWYPPVGTRHSANLWAPEIQYLQGKWYIYFAADDGANENHRMYALQADTDDPMGSYTFKGQIGDDTDKWAIDGLVMEHEGKLYFVWSGWEGDVNVQQNTYIAPMSDPLTISGPRVMLSEPDQEWERAGGPPYINEGQAILKHDGRVFLFYSGAGSWTPFYSIGALVLEPGADPLDPSAWRKLEQPLMQMDAEAGVFGPGHNTFAKSLDGTEDWIVYHATSGMQDGWNNRKARAQRIEWGEDGMPILGKPLALETAIPVPSGSGVYHADSAATVEGRLEFGSIPATVDSEVPVLVHYRNDTGADQTVAVFANGEQAGELALSSTGEEVGYAYATASLRKGMNAIGFGDVPEGVRIEAIELARFEAETGEAVEPSMAEENPFASGGGTAVIEPSDAEAALRMTNIRVPKAGEYRVRVAVSNASGEAAELVLDANGKKRTLDVPVTDRNDFQPAEVRLQLKAGMNAITIKDASTRVVLDYIDILQD